MACPVAHKALLGLHEKTPLFRSAAAETPCAQAWRLWSAFRSNRAITISPPMDDKPPGGRVSSSRAVWLPETARIGVDNRSPALSRPVSHPPNSDEFFGLGMYGKVLLCISEDWFALSHFVPLIETLGRLCKEVVLVTRLSGRETTLRHFGVRIVALNYHRKSLGLFDQAAAARALARIIEQEKPEVLHLVAMKPAILGAIATMIAPVPALVVHFTGLGHLMISKAPPARIARRLAFAMLAWRLHKQPSWLLAENPQDLLDLKAFGIENGAHFTVLGGAGVDPALYPSLPAPENMPPVAACVARMIRSKGIDVLIEAHDRLLRRGTIVDLELYGRADDQNPDAVPSATIAQWAKRPHVRWHGETTDVVGVWRRSDIAVLPARSREGMPRSVLEAAACARPLLVTDVPGPRHFVRDGIEGFVVAPESADAMADALECLARDLRLRIRMGIAARARVLSGFTEDHVRAGIEGAYATLRALLDERRGATQDAIDISQ